MAPLSIAEQQLAHGNVAFDLLETAVTQAALLNRGYDSVRAALHQGLQRVIPSLERHAEQRVSDPIVGPKLQGLLDQYGRAMHALSSGLPIHLEYKDADGHRAEIFIPEGHPYKNVEDEVWPADNVVFQVQS